MEQIIIYGDSNGNKLEGTVKIEGAKNAVLPVLAATLLAEEGVTTLRNVPILADVYTMIQVMKHLNADVDFNEELNEITVDATKSLEIEANPEFVGQMRASIIVMGPLLARCGRAKVSLPGGCTIGKRPIDLHLKGFKALGARIVITQGYTDATADTLRGTVIKLAYPSVGATQNIMMAAVKAQGVTVIQNVAKEPEIVELANVLNKMGAKITGAGTEILLIKGVDILYAIDHDIVQDRIEAGTFMIAAAMTEGNLLIKDAIYNHNRPLIAKLNEMGAIIREESDGIRVIGPKYIKPTEIQTSPWPGFPTDLQAQITAMQVLAKGRSIVVETVFENRFQHLEEILKMNADLEITGNLAIINGGAPLKGANVDATDLRAAAALILVGLRADGVTRVSNLHYLDRGYFEFHKKLQMLGARVERVMYSE